MALSSQQQQVLAAIFAGAARGHSDGTPVTLKELKAALETGQVESNFTNSAAMTDHDSQGWRQERASIYKDPTNLTHSVQRFFDETGAVKGRYGSAGALAAAVQRPAAQYRGRYQQASGIADHLLATFGKARGGAAGSAGVPARTVTATGTAGGGPVALPDTGDSGLSQLLASVSQKPAPVMVGGQIASPAFSADQRYAPNVGAIQPVGVNPIASSGVAGQLANLTAARDQSLPIVNGTSSTATATGTIPGVPASNPAVKNASGGAKATLAWARSTLGTAETNGTNTGPRINQWEKAFGMKGQPWCAIFTSIAVTKGGAPASARTASVAQVRDMARAGTGGYQHGFIDPSRAHAGDLILFGNDHIGLVESVSSKGITMIAGNDSNRVQRRTVALGAGDIVRPKYQ